MTIVYGLWWFKIIHDDLWTVCDDLWWSIVIYDDLWWSMMIYNDLWRFMTYDDL